MSATNGNHLSFIKAFEVRHLEFTNILLLQEVIDPALQVLWVKNTLYQDSKTRGGVELFNKRANDVSQLLFGP